MVILVGCLLVLLGSAGAGPDCREGCECPASCACDPSLTQLSCTAAGRVPYPLPQYLVKIDLLSNNITELAESSFTGLSSLEDLILGDNKITSIHPKTFSSTPNLIRLSFHNCGLTEVPSEALHYLHHLISLQLDQNALHRMEKGSLSNLTELRNLRLDANQLTDIPSEAFRDIPQLEVLNLGNNFITHIPVNAFSMLSNLVILYIKRNQIDIIHDDAFVNLTSLRVLELDDNLLTHIPLALTKLTNLQELSLSGNKIKYIPSGILQKAQGLAHLELKGNPLIGVDPHSFSFLPKLRKLVLSDARELKEFPSLNGTTALEILRIDRASIRIVPDTLCKTCPRIKSLDMKLNELSEVPNLTGCKDLRILDLSGNKIKSLEGNLFQGLNQMHDLLLSKNEIDKITKDAFFGLKKLQVLDLEGNMISEVHDQAFLNIDQLEDLYTKFLGDGDSKAFKAVSGKNVYGDDCPITKLECIGHVQKRMGARLRAMKQRRGKTKLSDGKPLGGRGSLTDDNMTLLQKYYGQAIRYNLNSIDNMHKAVWAEFFHIGSSDSHPNHFLCPEGENSWCGYQKARVKGVGYNHKIHFHLDYSVMIEIKPIFKDLANPELLKRCLHGGTQNPNESFNNVLWNRVPKNTFVRRNTLELGLYDAVGCFNDGHITKNLGNNIFPHLPTEGLDRLLYLKTFNNPFLRIFPPPEKFPRVQSLVLAYAYHCCAFLSLVPAEPLPRNPVHESVLFPTDNEFDMSLWNSSLTDIWPQLQNLSKKFGTQINQLWDNFGTDFTYPGNFPSYVEEYFEEQEINKQNDLPPGRIQCLPTPGPFLPCVDLFDWWTLRCGVWLVFLLAMLGNGTVVFVLIFSRSKIDVPRFLVCNLAAADFFMGVYLGMLAVVDASTLGEFEMYAIPWQMSAGCQLAGFLGVLSSELSVYTLAVITLERNYAITHAMHLNKRLSLKHAGYIMLCGWSFSIIMAILPLFGISDYRKFATCLPFETNTSWSLTYVVFLIFINGVAFLILMGCYLKMYCAIRGSQAWNSNDSRIAKRMALLVFTDFLCWSPIAFFSMTAAFGLQLVSLEQAKVFTVFVLPLNSCCNPFLYAILTKQFKKDCVLICKAIEESRVTRGIGRCRHSSNFSNRQTPANTNSLVDRSSRDNQVHQPCNCNIKLLGDNISLKRAPKGWLMSKLSWISNCLHRNGSSRHRTRSDQYAYQIAEIQQKQHKRASSVSSSENFSSSRSDSWRQNHHHCGLPMRLLDPKRRASSWIITRKTSQDSNLSSSRNDSSGSATTNSTTMSRVSRSSNSSEARPKPRLTRQSAIQDESELFGSPAKLTVRFLTTIPSAAETSVQHEDDNPCYAILHASQEQSPNTSQSPSPNSLKSNHMSNKRRDLL